MVIDMKKTGVVELLAPPSVVFILFYAFMLSKNLGGPLEFSLFIALLTLAIKVSKLKK